MPVPVPLRPPPPSAHPVLKDKIALAPHDVNRLIRRPDTDLPHHRIRSSQDPRDDWINNVHQASLLNADPQQIWQRQASIQPIRLSPVDCAASRPPLAISTIPASAQSDAPHAPIFASIAPVRPSLADVEMEREAFARAQDDFQSVSGRGWRASGAFTPIIEDLSPDGVFSQEAGSSPDGPATPFGEYVDRAVNASSAFVGVVCDFPERGMPDAYIADFAVDSAYVPPAGAYIQAMPSYGGTNVHPPSAQRDAEPLAAPSLSDSYRKLADPLAHWVSGFVWNVCTTGYGLPPVASRKLVPRKLGARCSTIPPGTLPESIHSLLLSTLLQPSAVFLALWYIVRLPVFLGHVEVEGNEAVFQEELQNGDASADSESFTAFRLVVLGFMLANKWLDDHTFSNKTWHTISHIPIHSLNRLEFLAVNLFRHDLSIAPASWTQWLDHLRAYHASIALADRGSPASAHTFPQPISRPAATPHSMIRKVLDDLADAPVMAGQADASRPPQPVYIGLKARIQEKISRDTKVNEVDLDEDGPLREEYVPRRRLGGADITQRPTVTQSNPQQIWKDPTLLRGRDCLPPPAKWSPEADEPILRERDRSTGRYVAVQPTFSTQSAVYRSPYEVGYQGYSWHERRIQDFHPDAGHTRSRSYSQTLGSEGGSAPIQTRLRSNTGAEYQRGGMQADLLVPPPPVLASGCWGPLITYALPYALQGAHAPNLSMPWVRA